MGDMVMSTALTTLAGVLASAVDNMSPARRSVCWELNLTDTDTDTVDTRDDPGPDGFPAMTVSFTAHVVSHFDAGVEPTAYLVGFEADPQAVGIAASWWSHTPAGELLFVAAMLRDTTFAFVTTLSGDDPIPVDMSDVLVPSSTQQAMRRAMVLPSGLPDVIPALLAARIQAAMLDSAASLPDYALPSTEALLSQLARLHPRTAAELDDIQQRWRDTGWGDGACRRGVLVSTLASDPTFTASLVTHPLAAALIPLMEDTTAWPVVVARLRDTPPQVEVPSVWWSWADEPMIAALLARGLPAIGASGVFAALVESGALPQDAVTVATMSIARIAAAGA